MNAILLPHLNMSHKSSILATVASVCTAALLLLSAGGANAQEKTTYIGPSVSFVGGGSLIGVNAKFKVADSISVRPFVQFGTITYGAFGNDSVTIFGASATYDLNIPRSDFNPYAGVGYQSGPGSKNVGFGLSIPSPITSGIYFEVGTDYNISDSIALNASYRIKDGGSFNLGGAYRF